MNHYEQTTPGETAQARQSCVWVNQDTFASQPPSSQINPKVQIIPQKITPKGYGKKKIEKEAQQRQKNINANKKQSNAKVTSRNVRATTNKKSVTKISTNQRKQKPLDFSVIPKNQREKYKIDEFSLQTILKKLDPSTLLRLKYSYEDLRKKFRDKKKQASSAGSDHQQRKKTAPHSNSKNQKAASSRLRPSSEFRDDIDDDDDETDEYSNDRVGHSRQKRKIKHQKPVIHRKTVVDNSESSDDSQSSTSSCSSSSSSSSSSN